MSTDVAPPDTLTMASDHTKSAIKELGLQEMGGDVKAATADFEDSLKMVLDAKEMYAKDVDKIESSKHLMADRTEAFYRSEAEQLANRLIHAGEWGARQAVDRLEAALEEAALPRSKNPQMDRQELEAAIRVFGADPLRVALDAPAGAVSVMFTDYGTMLVKAGAGDGGGADFHRQMRQARRVVALRALGDDPRPAQALENLGALRSGVGFVSARVKR